MKASGSPGRSRGKENSSDSGAFVVEGSHFAFVQPTAVRGAEASGVSALRRTAHRDQAKAAMQPVSRDLRNVLRRRAGIDERG